MRIKFNLIVDREPWKIETIYGMFCIALGLLAIVMLMGGWISLLFTDVKSINHWHTKDEIIEMFKVMLPFMSLSILFCLILMLPFTARFHEMKREGLIPGSVEAKKLEEKLDAQEKEAESKEEKTSEVSEQDGG